MWLFKHYRSVLIECVIKARVTLPTDSAKTQEGYLTLHSVIANYLLKTCQREDNLATVDADIRIFKGQDMTATHYVQQLWTRTLRRGSVWAEKILKELFVERVNKPICQTLHQRLSEYQLSSLKKLAQKEKSFTDHCGSKLRPKNQSDSERTKSGRAPGRNSGLQPRDRLILYFEQRSRSRSRGRHRNRSTPSDVYETPTAMSISVVVVVELLISLREHNLKRLYAILLGLSRREPQNVVESANQEHCIIYPEQ